MSVVAKNNQRLKDTVIKLLYFHQSLSLAELSKRAKKSLPVITLVINGLMEEGLVIEQGYGLSTGGRRPQVYLLNPDLEKYTIGLSIDQFVTSLVVYDMFRKQQSKVFKKEINILNSSALAEVLAFVKEALATTKIQADCILGMGLGMPGFVDHDLGTNASFLKPEGVQSLASYFTEALGLPVFIDNDSSLIALAELNFGLAKGRKNILVVNLGWGTGLGLVINGLLYRGSSGYAGEFSHIPLANHKESCTCGKLGCLEVETSLKIMAHRYAQKANKDVEGLDLGVLADDFFDAAINGDAHALAVIAEGGYMLGKGLATLMHILNPSMIVLSGLGAKIGQLWLPSVQMGINEFCIPRIAQQTQIKISEIYEEAQLLAAASLVIEHLSLENANLILHNQSTNN